MGDESSELSPSEAPDGSSPPQVFLVITLSHTPFQISVALAAMCYLMPPDRFPLDPSYTLHTVPLLNSPLDGAIVTFQDQVWDHV